MPEKGDILQSSCEQPAIESRNELAGQRTHSEEKPAPVTPDYLPEDEMGVADSKLANHRTASKLLKRAPCN